MALNCAALVDTLLEAELFGIEDHAATASRDGRASSACGQRHAVFLDEVGDLSASAQAKLLRALQDLSVEGGRPGRTSRRHARGRHQRDSARSRMPACFVPSHYRLAGLDMHVPPLRIGGDIIELATYFLERHRPGMSAVAVGRRRASHLRLARNVRELEAAMERTVTLARERHSLQDLPLRSARDGVSCCVHGRRRRFVVGSRYVRLVLERIAATSGKPAARSASVSHAQAIFDTRSGVRESHSFTPDATGTSDRRRRGGNARSCAGPFARSFGGAYALDQTRGGCSGRAVHARPTFNRQPPNRATTVARRDRLDNPLTKSDRVTVPLSPRASTSRATHLSGGDFLLEKALSSAATPRSASLGKDAVSL